MRAQQSRQGEFGLATGRLTFGQVGGHYFTLCSPWRLPKSRQSIILSPAKIFPAHQVVLAFFEAKTHVRISPTIRQSVATSFAAPILFSCKARTFRPQQQRGCPLVALHALADDHPARSDTAIARLVNPVKKLAAPLAELRRLCRRLHRSGLVARDCEFVPIESRESWYQLCIST